MIRVARRRARSVTRLQQPDRVFVLARDRFRVFESRVVGFDFLVTRKEGALLDVAWTVGVDGGCRFDDDFVAFGVSEERFPGFERARMDEAAWYWCEEFWWE